jgi:LPS-assembly protein
VRDGRFTTCDGEIPDWRFTADQVDLTFGGYVTARDVWFEIRDQPVLYLPYLIFPAVAKRESGFLLPRGGYSSRKGAVLSLAWYQVLDRHLDATVYLDYLSELGLGKGLEYRYILGGDNRGEALLYHVSGIGATPDSYAVNWQHGGNLPGAVRLTADVEYVNKLEFFEDFGETADEYNRDQAVSTVMLQRNWEKFNLTGYARYIKDLASDNDATMQRLPELGLDVPFYRLGESPLYTRTELRATNFSRQEGDDGQRLLLRQGLGLVLKPGGWLEFSPEVAVYGRAYHADSGDESDLIPEYSATLSTRLIRIYPFDRWGIERLQHSVEPQLRYLYVPDQDQDDLPEFSQMDRIEPRNLVAYALVNRLTARSIGVDGVPTYREVLNLRLSQSYDIREERDDEIVDPEPFSDLRIELALLPTTKSFLAMDATTRVYDELQVTRFDAAAGYDDRRGNLALVNYTYRRAGLGVEPTDYLGVELTTAWLDPVHLRVEERYDFRDTESLESVIGMEYRAKCWSLFLTYRDRPDSEEVMVGFALSGLGQVNGFGSTLRPLDEQP